MSQYYFSLSEKKFINTSSTQNKQHALSEIYRTFEITMKRFYFLLGFIRQRMVFIFLHKIGLFEIIPKR